jgi:glycosyltransferase involved in cell wall biosynthesis
MLVTFALFSFNQENFIQEAVESALAQTYDSLEIIISDDCSSDKTFEIIQEIVAGYTGLHNVIINKNMKNMGISKHIRYIDEIAKGEIIIHAAGDDISYPDRSSKLVQAFLNEKKQPSLLMSNAHIIDESGDIVGILSKPLEIIRELNADPMDISFAVGACTFAISKELVDAFAPPLDGIYGEDRLLMFRAKLLNGTLYIPDILVKYRISRYGVWSSGFMVNLETKDLLNRQESRARDFLLFFQQASADVKSVRHPNSLNILTRLEELSRMKNNWVGVMSKGLLGSSVCFFSELKHGSLTFELFKIYTFRWFPIIRKIKRIFSNRFDHTNSDPYKWLR